MVDFEELLVTSSGALEALVACVDWDSEIGSGEGASVGGVIP